MLSYAMKTRITALLAAMLSLVSYGQTADTTDDGILQVYLDGVDYYQDYIRQEVVFVNYVRDRFSAQIHLLITGQSTASGGIDFNLFFIGQQQFSGSQDTLHVIAGTNETDQEIREKLKKSIEIGLLPYALQINPALPVEISYTGASTSNEKQEEDKWNGWIYSISGNGSASLNSNNRSFYLSGSVSASRITEEWKLLLSSGGSYNTDIYELGDNEQFIGYNNSFYNTITVVNALNEHWSFGGEAFYSASTYGNFDGYLNISPAIEYNIFPYSDNATRLLTVFYKIGPEYQNFIDTTIYGKTESWLLRERLDTSLSLTQKWGSISLGLNGSNYFHDFSKNSFGAFTSFNWRIVEGLNFNGYCVLQFLNDQLNLPKGDLSDEEILLQIAVQQTDYSLFTFFGLSYTFGSIFNNVVNPRFDGASSGIFL